MSENFCVSLYMNLIHTIFNIFRVISDIYGTHKFQDIWRIFTRVKACINRQSECINTYKLCWKMFKTNNGKQWKSKSFLMTVCIKVFKPSLDLTCFSYRTVFGKENEKWISTISLKLLPNLITFGSVVFLLWPFQSGTLSITTLCMVRWL